MLNALDFRIWSVSSLHCLGILQVGLRRLAASETQAAPQTQPMGIRAEIAPLQRCAWIPFNRSGRRSGCGSKAKAKAWKRCSPWGQHLELLRVARYIHPTMRLQCSLLCHTALLLGQRSLWHDHSPPCSMNIAWLPSWLPCDTGRLCLPFPSPPQFAFLCLWLGTCSPLPRSQCAVSVGTMCKLDFMTWDVRAVLRKARDPRTIMIRISSMAIIMTMLIVLIMIRR